MTRFNIALTVAVVLIAAATASHAADQQPQPLTPNAPGWPSPQAEAKLRGAIDQMVDAFTELLREVPRYAAPEIDQNGDIILRRLPSPGAPQRLRPPPQPDEDRT